jgi:Flp pilus assembly protein TadG
MRNQRGSTMVETVLVLMLALTVIFGIMEFGRAIFTYHAISNAARLGSRYAIVHGANCIPSGCTATQASVQTFVRNSTPGVTPSNMTVTPVWSGTDLNGGACSSSAENPGCTVTVTVTYPFTYILKYFGFGGRAFTISSSSQMVVAN